MAEDEVRIRVKLDVEDAKRDVNEINRGLEKGKDKADDWIKMARGAIGRGVALAAAAGGAIDRGVGGGFLGTAAGLAGDFIGAGARAAAAPFGGLGGLQEGVARNNALDRAIETTKSLVGAGGDISDQDIKALIQQFRDLYTPGSRNEQRVAVAGQEERVGMALENAARNFNDAAEKIGRMLGLATR